MMDLAHRYNAEGSASITIDDSGVKLVYSGKIKIKAVMKNMVAGMKVNAPMVSLPTSGLFSKAFNLKKLIPQDLIDQGMKYKIINHSQGTEIKGTLDKDGQTLRVFGDSSESIEMRFEQEVYFLDEYKKTYNEEDIIKSSSAFKGKNNDYYNDEDCC